MLAPEVLVLILPVALPAAPIVSVFTEEKRKQYSVSAERLLLGKVTVVPETPVAVEIPGQAVAPERISLVETVQLEEVALTVKFEGNVICISSSVPLSDKGVLAQTIPPVVVAALFRSRRTEVWESVPA